MALCCLEKKTLYPQPREKLWCCQLPVFLNDKILEPALVLIQIYVELSALIFTFSFIKRLAQLTFIAWRSLKRRLLSHQPSYVLSTLSVVLDVSQGGRAHYSWPTVSIADGKSRYPKRCSRVKNRGIICFFQVLVGLLLVWNCAFVPPSFSADLSYLEFLFAFSIYLE